MNIEYVPINKVMEQEEVANRIANGWIIAGQLPMQVGSNIATPDNVGGAQIMPCTIWVLHEPMVPISEVLRAIFEAAEQYQEAATALLVVDYMCMRFTGVTLAELKEGMENANPNPGEPEATGSDDTGVVVEAGNVIKPHEAA